MHLTALAPFLGRELAAVEEASALGPLTARFLSGLSEPVLREYLRRCFLRVRTPGELHRLRARYAEFAAYFPPPSQAA
jgi:hypothetical protein